MELPFVGGAYTGKSTNVNVQQCINLFPVIDNRGGKVTTFLHGTPGGLLFSTLAEESDTTVNRGMYTFNNILYTVLGEEVYSVTALGVKTKLGDITTTVGNVFFTDNGKEILLVDGTNQGHLITTGSLNLISDADFPIATSCTFQDGYFIITSNQGKIYISKLYDGTSWNALDFATAESNPDEALSVISNNQDLWIIGEKVTEIYYNSGNVDFPFTRMSGAIIELGTISAATTIKIDGVIYWLSNKGRVVRNNGYRFSTISTSHVDYQISTYEDISDVRAFTYTKQGHIFYVLIFPSVDKTWVYDVTTDFWHEWQSYSAADEETPWGRNRANSCTKLGDDYIVGDYENGLLYELKMTTFSDNGNEIRRIRTNQIVNKERFNIIWHQVELDFETGVGLDGGVQGENPQVALEWSKDGGHTWSNEHWKSFGKIGKYKTRVKWNRLGKSRNRVLRITISDPVKVVILAAFAELEECNA